MNNQCLKLVCVETKLFPADFKVIYFKRYNFSFHPFQIDTKNPCGSKTCSCRKYGVQCVSTCGECRGTECSNAQVSVPFTN